MSNCGECTACCSFLEIKSIDKPKHTACQHMTAGGCSVYSDRPAVCRKFECAYVANDWAEYLRPDKCGVMIANFGGVYAALRLFEKVDNRIMDQIKFMAKEYGLRIEGIDARVGA